MTQTLRELYAPGSNRALGLQADDLIYVGGLEPERRSDKVSLEEIRRQTRQVLSSMETILRDAGGSPDNLARATGYVSDAGEQREAVYDCWDRLFPSESDKPAFKILDAPLPEGILVRFDFIALLGQSRTRIDIPGVDARDPTVRIGNWVLTSRLHGTSPETGKTVEGLEGQARQAVKNGIRLVELAGGSVEDVTQICGFGRDLSFVPALRRVIEEEFDGVSPMPSFQTVTTFVRPVLEVMVEVTARLKG